MKRSILMLMILCVAACQQAHSEASEVEGSSQIDAAVHAKFDFVKVKEAAKLIKNNSSVIILDVRTSKEFDAGHIQDAINVDYLADSFQTEVSKLDREAHYLLHCKSGRRSNGALKAMKALGFKHITHMDGGFDSWKEAEIAVVK